MNYNTMIDHTALKADTTYAMIEKLCNEAIEYQFATVCVNPTWVSKCKELLINSDVRVCTVIGFPLGANTPAVKAFEADEAIKSGADEIDMVINIGALKDGNDILVKEDIAAVVKAAHPKCVKVIIETCLLTKAEIVKVCKIAKEANAAFVKTSTGFNVSGATIEDVQLMKQTVGDEMLVKASGGVSSFQDMVDFVSAGASRIGTSSGCKLIKEEIVETDY